MGNEPDNQDKTLLICFSEQSFRLLFLHKGALMNEKVELVRNNIFSSVQVYT